MKNLILFLLSLAVAAGCAYAAIYVHENTAGGVEFTDTPTATSNKIDVPPTNSITTAKPETAAVESEKVDPQSSKPVDASTSISNADTYTTFEISSPHNGETFQNRPVIPVEMKIEPNMLPGDKIQLMLDNAPRGTPTAASYQELGLIERGTHTLYAVIINKQDQIIKRTAEVTLYIHRNSTITSPTSRR